MVVLFHRQEVRRLAGAPKGQPGAEIDLDRPALEGTDLNSEYSYNLPSVPSSAVSEFCASSMQCDASLGKKIATRLNVKPSM